MASNGSTDRKRREFIKQNRIKIDQILRLTDGLEREISRITGEEIEIREHKRTNNYNFKLDIICDQLLKLRETLEKNFKHNIQNNCQTIVSEIQQNSVNPNVIPVIETYVNHNYTYSDQYNQTVEQMPIDYNSYNYTYY